MGVDATYPMTLGQLSVWLDIVKMPPERRWEANLVFVWDIPSGHSVDEVWSALTAIAMRHESLRTTYLVDPDLGLRQRLAADNPTDAFGSVRQGTADVSEREKLEDEGFRRIIDVTRDMPWIAWVLTTEDVPTHVLLVVNHMAADGAAALIMQDDFRTFLAGAGDTLEPASTPRELAIRQNEGEGASRIRSAEKFWRRTLEAAPRLSGTETPAERLGATLHTGIPLPMAHEGAAKLEISLASLVVTAYHRALRSVLGTSTVLLYPMSSNRFDSETVNLVTSLNQWVPLLIEFDEAEPFPEVARKTHWKTFNALKYGIVGADKTHMMRDEFEAMNGDPGYYFNPILAPPGFPTDAVFEPSSVEWYEPAKATGPGFYLIARGISTIDMIVRTKRPGWTKEGLSAFLASMQGTLLEAIGMDEPPAPGSSAG